MWTILDIVIRGLQVLGIIATLILFAGVAWLALKEIFDK